MRARSVGDVVVHAHRKRVRLLEHHADTFSQKVHVHAVVDVLAVQFYCAGNPAALNEVVHTVQGFQQRTFAAAGRPDERGDLVRLNLYMDGFQRMEIAVIQIQIFDCQFTAHIVSPIFSGVIF